MAKFATYVFEVIGWIRLFGSFFLLGIFTGYIIWFSFKNTLTLILGIAVGGFLWYLGLKIANKARKSKMGTYWLASRYAHSPDLDEVSRNTRAASEKK